MKKYLLTALIAVFGMSAANAQFEKGTKTVNVKTSGLEVETLSGDGYSEREVYLGAEGAYFIVDRISVMAEFSIESEKEYDRDDAISTVHLGGGARYYFSDKGWFAGAGLLAYIDTAGERISAITGKIEGGYTWYIGDRFYVEPAIQLLKDYDTGASKVSPLTKFRFTTGFGIKF
ncbi:MAG: autotransporter outer membrane beta-barrel domain-containing protein [Tannerella sp.]|nr:autotransporter outer membrane beta-barrel domain-containing protein [Tannerella sp.]